MITRSSIHTFDVLKRVYENFTTFIFLCCLQRLFSALNALALLIFTSLMLTCYISHENLNLRDNVLGKTTYADECTYVHPMKAFKDLDLRRF